MGEPPWLNATVVTIESITGIMEMFKASGNGDGKQRPQPKKRGSAKRNVSDEFGRVSFLNNCCPA
jgi:hypothetical protein